jgi:hypothetical protein
MISSTSYELLISGVTIISAWYIGNKNVWGQRLGLFCNILWWLYVFIYHRWGFMPVEIFFTIITIRNLVKWEKEARLAI